VLLLPHLKLTTTPLPPPPSPSRPTTQHTADPNASSKVGYAFPLDDNHPVPGVAAPAPAGTTRRSGSGNGANGNKRAAAGSNGSSRRGSPASLTSEGDGSEPMRKRERKSPIEPNSAEVK
jgi:hypothetical protein